MENIENLQKALLMAIKTLEEFRPVNVYVWVGDDQFNVGDVAEFALKNIQEVLKSESPNLERVVE